VCFPSYACCVDLLCVLACVEVVVLLSGAEVRVRVLHMLRKELYINKYTKKL
jgi:hypothetical protein